MRCCETLTKESVTSLRYPADNHNDVRPLSDASLAEALQKFVVCSCQLLSVLSDKPFVSFLDDFQKLTIQNYVIGHTIPARNLLPSPNTISRRITYSIDTAKIQLLDQIAMLKQNGGGIILDFAKKAVQVNSSASEQAFKELRSSINDYTRNKLEPKSIANLIVLRKMIND